VHRKSNYVLNNDTEHNYHFNGSNSDSYSQYGVNAMQSDDAETNNGNNNDVNRLDGQ